MYLDICMASSDMYSVHLGICIVSIAENNSSNIRMHILNNNISEVNLDKLKSLENKYDNLKINFYDTTDFFKEKEAGNIIKQELKDSIFYTRLGIPAFSRLFLEDILPDDIKKIIYLDADTIVLKPLDELFNMDLNNHLIAGVVDIMSNLGVYFYQGDEKTTPFVNSGVLLINLEKWREIGFADLSIDLIKRYSNKDFMHDQNIINIICGDDVCFLNPKYNVMSEFFYVDYKKNLKFNNYFASIEKFNSPEVVYESLKHPVVVHFMSQVWDRPWMSQVGLFKHAPKNPFNDCYHYYKSISPWSGEKIQENEKKFFTKAYYESIRFITMHFPVSFIAFFNYIKNKYRFNVK